MKKFIFMNCILAITYGWTVSKDDHCSCSDYIQMFDCKKAYIYGCEWSTDGGGTCQNVNCTGKTEEKCFLYRDYCYFDSKNSTNPCQTFSSCSNLQGKNNLECWQKNPKCIKLNETGPNCINFNCSLFSTDKCPTPSCAVDGDICTDYANCTAIKKEQDCDFPRQCYFDGNECKWEKCSDFKESSSCFSVATSDKRIEPCIWNENNTCTNVPGPESLDIFNCFSLTRGAFHWSSNDLEGDCIQCLTFGIVLQCFLVIILFFV